MATKINNKVYNWGSIRVRYGASILAEATEIEYSESQEIEEVYAAGSDPYGPGIGNKSRTGKLVVLEEWATRLESEAKSQGTDVLGLQFNIDVIKNDGVNPIVVDKIFGAIPKNNSRKAKQGDKSLVVEYDLYISNIQFNA